MDLSIHISMCIKNYSTLHHMLQSPTMFSLESMSFSSSMCVYISMYRLATFFCATVPQNTELEFLKSTINIQLRLLQKPVCLLCAQ